MKKKWMKVVNKGISKAYVCSEHFHIQDYDENNQLKANAVPSALQICRICLSVDTGLFSMSESCIEQYEQYTGHTISENDDLPQNLCWECLYRLQKSMQFRSQAIRSYTLMLKLLEQHQINIDTIKLIDRQKNNLTTNLTVKLFEPNHNNIHLHEVTENNDQIDPIELTNIHTEINFYIDDDTKSDILLESTNDVVKRKKGKEKDRERKRKKDNKVDRRRKPANEVLSEDIFVITELSLEEQVSEIRKRQESANFKNSEYKCFECFKGFLDEEAYKGHIFRHTAQIGSHQCQICKIYFKTAHALRNHGTSHMQKFCCKRCPYVTTRRHAAKLHEEFHKGTRYPCPHCQEDFGKFSTYMSHIRIKHPSDFVCELCGYSFISEKGLGLHKKLKHRFEEPTVPPDGPYCEECNVRFATSEALDRHLKMSARHKHTTEDSISKKPRDRSSERQKEGQSKKRRSVQKPEGPIPCEQCEMQLPDSLAYYRHFRRMHPDKNRTNYPSMKSKSMCEVCGKMFQSLALLQDHSWTHTDSKQFTCTQCNKSFQRKYRLIAHRRVHALSRSWHGCLACGKRLSSASNMRRHMLSHTGVKPFKCEMCGKGFKHASEKRVHITYVHLKKPWPKRARGKRRTDGRTDDTQPAPSIDMGIEQPLWSACSEPKILEDKHIYYNTNIK